MRRRGYRLWGEQWLPREEYAARLRAHEEAEARRREDARQDRIARAIEALVAVELSRAPRPEPAPEPPGRRPGPRGQLVAVFPGAYFPFVRAGRRSAGGRRGGPGELRRSGGPPAGQPVPGPAATAPRVPRLSRSRGAGARLAPNERSAGFRGAVAKPLEKIDLRGLVKTFTKC